nr:MAG TPA: hypothetical protein [Caudoviricetes sp.]
MAVVVEASAFAGAFFILQKNHSRKLGRFLIF